jgi:IS5 family transposase
MYLQHLHGLSDEAVVDRWVENPYFQHFTGEMFFQHRAPIHPSSLSRWRDRIGDEGAEWLLTKTIEAGRPSGVVKDESLSQVSIDTTVMEKNIAYPTDARLYEKARAKIVALAQETGITLRQTYARKAPLLAAQVGRYAHARQFKRMRKALRTLKGYTGRVMRDLRRQLSLIPTGALRETILDTLALVSRLLHQPPKGGGKIYALHEPDVDCIRCPADDAKHRREGQRVKPGSGTNLAPRSASPPRSRKASWWAYAPCRAIPMTGTRWRKPWNR